MTTKNKKFCSKQIIIFIVLFFSLNSVIAETANKKWVLACEKFTFTKGQTSNSVTESMAEMIPSRILEKAGQKLVRSVDPDERLERVRYDSRKERISLFLQLSSAYKKRDAVVLNQYSQREFKRKVAEQEKSIKDIQDKISANLDALKEAEENTEKLKERQESESLKKNVNSSGELKKYGSLVKNLFVKREEVFSAEDINFYRGDVTSLYTAGTKAKAEGYTSYAFEKEAVSAGINTLLTGQISVYGDFISVSVDMYLYPGAKKIGSVMEVGSLQDFDFISSNLAGQLVPILTNSMPVEVDIVINSDQPYSEAFMYLDDQLQANFLNNTLIIDSGVHTLQFAAKGFKTAGTSYFFEGNQHYLIEVNLEDEKDGLMLIGIKRPAIDLFLQSLPFQKKYPDYGTVYANSMEAKLTEEGLTQITINGNKILGQFITENGESAFYYVPKKLIADGNMVSINPKPFDRADYIDVRRRWMYGSYSMLITSLIPTFYFYGTYNNMASRWNSLYDTDYVNSKDYNEALRYQNLTKVCTTISISCGVFFVYELLRYFKAADTVLPTKAEKTDYVNPIIWPEKSEIVENPDDSDLNDSEIQDSEKENSDGPDIISNQPVEENNEIQS